MFLFYFTSKRKKHVDPVHVRTLPKTVYRKEKEIIFGIVILQNR